MNNAITLLEQLIACPSLTPKDAGCQTIIQNYLKPLGFTCTTLQFDDVTNLWATYGQGSPVFVFAGHTDVVPPGPAIDWISPPFTPTHRDDCLFGRGAVDMKGALAAMVIAAQRFITAQPFVGTIGFLITSDEEGPAINGTKQVVEWLLKQHKSIDYCVIGEPSSIDQVGDQIRIGRRGSLHGKVTIQGKQGHVALPHLAANPIHESSLPLHQLSHTLWDNGNDHFPPTTFQITNIQSGTEVRNVIPGHFEAFFNLRFGTASTIASLKDRTKAIFDQMNLPYYLDWILGAEPFLTKKGQLMAATQSAIKEITGMETQCSTAGGTSDGRFIIKLGSEIIELGMPHQTAHQVNEYVRVKDLHLLTDIYVALLTKLLTTESDR